MHLIIIMICMSCHVLERLQRTQNILPPFSQFMAITFLWCCIFLYNVRCAPKSFVMPRWPQSYILLILLFARHEPSNSSFFFELRLATKKRVLFLKLALGFEFKNMPSDLGDDRSIIRNLWLWYFKCSCCCCCRGVNAPFIRTDRLRFLPSPCIPGLNATLWSVDGWVGKEGEEGEEGVVGGERCRKESDRVVKCCWNVIRLRSAMLFPFHRGLWL